MYNLLLFLPLFLALLITLLTKEVLLSLFTGILVGLFILHGLTFNVFEVFLNDFLITSLINTDHVNVLLFTLFIGAFVSVLKNGGGLKQLIFRLSKKVKSRRGAEFLIFLMGCVVFFDDYANTLIVGSTSRELADRFKIPRAKLAYIVDSTSAPIASIALASTWIGVQLGFVDAGLKQTSFGEISAYSVFLSSLKYAFYPIMTMVFMVGLISSRKEYGPMKHEQSIFSSSNYSNSEKPASMYKALLPIVILLFFVFFALYKSGSKESGDGSLLSILGNADAGKALLWSSFCALLVASVFNFFNVKKNTLWIIEGVRNMLEPIIILVMAWVFSDVLGQLGVATLLIELLGGAFPVFLFPCIVFLVAVLVSFVTGSSWGTMAILYPLVLPMAGVYNDVELFAHVVAVVLGGAVFGDHCSPVSDTTILSSIATECGHITHVKTQIPYALSVGVVCMVLSLMVGLGVWWWLTMFVGIAFCLSQVYVFGVKRKE